MSVQSLAVVASAFIASTLFENEPAGFLSVTVMGIALANQTLVSIRGVVVFKEMLRTLILPALFIILAARLPMSDLPLIDVRAFIFLGFLILVIRPAAVFGSMRSSGLSVREKVFLSSMAPRGIVAAAVASLFSDRLIEAGVPGANAIVVLVFFVVSSTVIFYAAVSPLLAHVLKVSRPRSGGILFFGASDFAIELARALKEEGAEVLLIDRNADRVRAAGQAGLEAVSEDVFSDEVLDQVEERGLGRLLALTPNQEANSLAVEHFRYVMNPGETYQLVPPEKSKLREGHHLVGRFLFEQGMDFNRLEAAFWGKTISRIHPEASRAGCSPLFWSDGKGGIEFSTTDHEGLPGPGKTLFALVPKRSNGVEIASPS